MDSSPNIREESQAEKDMAEIIDQLKVKFNEEQDRSFKVYILTMLPSSWSRKKVSEEKAILSCPNPKPGKTLRASAVDVVTKFYNSDDISREMPVMKDEVTSKLNGSKVTAQKRLILSTLKETYHTFKKHFPNY